MSGIRNSRSLSAVDVDIPGGQIEARHARLTENTKAATMIKAPRGAFIFLGIFLILAAGGLIVALTVYFTTITVTIGNVCNSQKVCTTGASCSNGFCACNTGYYTDGTYCYLYVQPFQTCTPLSTVNVCCCNATCLTTSGTSVVYSCQCGSNSYFDSVTGQCTAKLAYNATCRMDQSCTSNYVCNSVSYQCACPSNYVFPYLGIGQYATACWPIKYPSQACDGTVYTPCIANAYCNASAACTCNTGYFFNVSALTCDPLKTVGTQCSSVSECIPNSICTIPSSGINYVCQCQSNYYYNYMNATCGLMLNISSTQCYYTYQCPPNATCTKLASNSFTTCECSSATYPNPTGPVTSQCMGYVGYAASCYNTSQCFTNGLCYAPAANIGKQCLCASTAYYDSASVSCTTLLLPGKSCSYTYQCVTNAACVIPNGGSSTICQCSTGYFYNVAAGSCVAVYTYYNPCTTSTQCNTNLGLQCISSKCDCPNLAAYAFYWTGSTCASQVSYGLLCNQTSSRMCNSVGQGLSCISGSCSCPSTQYWSGSQCLTWNGYTGACQALSWCNTNIGLQCINGICACNSTQYFSSSASCSRQSDYGQTCWPDGNSQCLSSKGLYCNTGPWNCQCTSNQYYDSMYTLTCVNKLSSGFLCPLGIECSTTMNLNCISGYCTCNSAFYYLSNGICVTLLSNSQACTLDSQCNFNNGLYCINLVCSCQSSQYWTGSVCTNILTYNQGCSSNSMCNSTKGLACYSGLCACNSLNYWSSTSTLCLTKLLIGSSCSTLISNQCDNNKFLICNSGSNTCTCSTTMYYNYDIPICYALKTYYVGCVSVSECNNNLGLTCSSGICLCATQGSVPYYWSGSTCVATISNGVSCASNSNACNTALGLVCSSGSCVCGGLTYWTGSTCAAQLVNGGSNCLSSNIRCQISLGFVCYTTTCGCLANYYINAVGGQCVAQTTYSTACVTTTQCITAKSLQCTSGVCQCATTAYWDVSAQTCVTLKGSGATCTYNYECNYAVGLTLCTSSGCTCTSGYYYSGSTCVTQVSYGGGCSSTSQCVTSQLTTCSGVCTCITATQYYQSSTSQCVSKKSYGGYCIYYSSLTNAIDNCDYSNLLTCTTGGICDCNSSNYYWSGTTCTYGNYGAPCSATLACATSLGLVCKSSTCKCDTLWIWDGSKCIHQ